MKLLASLLLALTLTLPVPSTLAEQPPVTLKQAAKQVKKKTGGRILSAEERWRNGELKYRIKILTKKGVVRVVWIDPAPGSE